MSKKHKIKTEKVTEETTWAEPDAGLLSDLKYAAPEFPIEIFSDKWREFLLDTAASKSTPVDFVALPLLVVFAGMIGNARRGQMWDEWKEPTILWGMLIGEPSSGKSPALKACLNPVSDYERDLAEQYKSVLQKHLEEKEIADMHDKSWKLEQKKAVEVGDETQGKPSVAITPPQPPRPRAMVTDTTIEKVAVILSENERGLLLARDELSGFIKNFNAYSSGQDREFYLQAYDGDSYPVDRVKHPEPIVIESLSISILGGIQPEKLDALLKNTEDDGFAARFLFVWPNPVPFKRPTKTPNKELFASAIKKLRGLEMQKNLQGVPQSVHIPFSEKAKNFFEKWVAKRRKKEGEVFGMLKSHLGKTPGMAIRLAVVLAYMDWVVSSKDEPKKIGRKHIKNAVKLLDGYFFPMAQRALGEATLPREQRDARLLAKWIIKEKRILLNIRDVKRMKGSPLRDANRLYAAFEFLKESDWIRFEGGREGQSIGRERMDYEVNPKVFTLPQE